MDPLTAREAELGALASERFDLLVVGGGIVGAGALLDATSRGLRAALIEQDDIASGTSSRSSRLIHGGLRYLEQLRFGLVSEALAERSRLLHLAPHLVRLEPFLFPVYGLPLVHHLFYGSGILLYDLLGSRREGGWARHLSRDATLALTPALRRDGLRGGIVYHDGVEDDARYALAVARTAQERGARIATRIRATGMVEATGRLRGVRVADLVSGGEFEVRADRVIDATGVWAARRDGPLASGPGRILPSRGAHLVVSRDRIPSEIGVTIRVPGKVIFLVPWPGHWLIGTTDHADDGRPDRPSATAADVDELLTVVNRYMAVDLSRADLLGTYAGLRPLAAEGGGGSTVKASREHRVRIAPNGLVQIGGGKYTTYRVMARDAVDAALGPDEARRRPSATADLRLVGAADREVLDRLAAELSAAGLAGPMARRLVDRHGTEAPAVVALGRQLDLDRPLSADLDVLEAEVAWAASRELALTVDDVLARRTRLAQERPDRAASLAPRVAEILGAELGWNGARRDREVDAFLESAVAEFGVPPAAVPPPDPAAAGALEPA